MSLTNKVIILAAVTLVFGGLLFLTPLKNGSPSSSPWTLIVMVLAAVSLVCFVVYFVKMLIKK
jgi:hypothetical protein